MRTSCELRVLSTEAQSLLGARGTDKALLRLACEVLG